MADLPMSLMPFDDLLAQAALARRSTLMMGHDPTALRIGQYADELETEILRWSRLA